MPDIIAPPKTLDVGFELAPALNVVNSLHMLQIADQFSGLDDWVYQTAAKLTPEQGHRNRLMVEGLDFVLHPAQKSWPSFTAWLDDLAVRDARTLRDQGLDRLIEEAAEVLNGDIPTVEQLLADRAVYLSLFERLHQGKEKGARYEGALYREAYALVSDPPAMQRLIVTHGREMWDAFLAAEWERREGMLQESIAAFRTLDFTAASCAEIVRRVTGRDLQEQCDRWQEQIERIVFIPSPHLGPYVSLVDVAETVRLIFGARIPQGAAVRSPELTRSELLMRLNALADETRLRILEILAQTGELGSQDVMERLDLSQSAASRHLRQLAATGYLSVERREGAKFYRLNLSRIDEAFDALKQYVQ